MLWNLKSHNLNWLYLFYLFFRCYSETRSASVNIKCNHVAAELGHEAENMMLLQPPSPPFTAVAAITQVGCTLGLNLAYSPGLFYLGPPKPVVVVVTIEDNTWGNPVHCRVLGSQIPISCRFWAFLWGWRIRSLRIIAVELGLTVMLKGFCSTKIRNR